MLERGFTTVRDTGGATKVLANAIEEGLIVGPRLFQCGKAISQTGMFFIVLNTHASTLITFLTLQADMAISLLLSLARTSSGAAEVERQVFSPA